MYAVVVDRLQGEPGDNAKKAASVLGGTAYDMRASMNVPDGGPTVLTVLADAQAAEAARAQLQATGFTAAVVAVAQVGPRIDVRRFEFTESAVVIDARQGPPLELVYGDVDLLIRASAVTTTSSTKTVKERKLSIGRAALSGGLINTRTTKSQQTTRSTDSDELLYLFRGDAAPVRMSEHGLQFQGLGDAVQPSRTANFMYTTDVLRRRCVRAGYDERLRRRAVQAQTLGRTLSPDDHLELAIDLVAASRRDGS